MLDLLWAAFAAFLVLDWLQTLRIFREGWQELNPVIRAMVAALGNPHGVNAYFVLVLTAAGGLWLIGFDWALLAAIPQGLCVVSNWRRGIKP